jgi:hypothetical protein
MEANGKGKPGLQKITLDMLTSHGPIREYLEYRIVHERYEGPRTYEVLETTVATLDSAGMITVMFLIKYPEAEKPEKFPVVCVWPMRFHAWTRRDQEEDLVTRALIIADKYLEKFVGNPPKVDFFDTVPFKKKKKDPNRRTIIRPLQKRRKKGEREKP